MKKVFLFLILCLLWSGVQGYAEEKPYIVQLNNTVQLLSDGPVRKSQQFIAVSEEELADYLDAGMVKTYFPNAMVELYGEQWNLDYIDADFPERVGCLGQEVKVAVIDSGLQELDTLGDCALEGYNYLAEKNGGDTSDTTDKVGHGTFVSGIIASDTYGIAKNCKLIPLKCFDSKTGDLLYVLYALYDAIDIYGADVINMSVGFADNPNMDGYDAEIMGKMIAAINEAVQYATDRGAIVVAAVGNDGNPYISYPAGSPGAIGVSAVAKNGTWCSFCQYNNSVFIAAPGMELTSTAITGYTSNYGTSFATPHVTAMAAIAKSMDKDITPEEFKAVLQKTATDAGTVGYDAYYGHGILNCEATTKALMGEEKVYISPVVTTDTGSYAVIYNHSDEALTAECLFAAYGNEGDAFYSNKEQKTLASDEVFIFENVKKNGRLRYMVWNNLTKVQPLAISRER